MTERPLVRVRILGKSEAPEFEVRRAVICTLDARVERPELREFKFDPIDRVLQDRGLSAARVVCGNRPVASVRFGMVAPSDPPHSTRSPSDLAALCFLV